MVGVIGRLPRLARHFSSSASKIDLAGVYTPITTPYHNNGNILYNKLEENITRWMKTSLKGFVVHGSTGEYVFLPTEERLKMVRVIKQCTGSEKQVIAGSGCDSTSETIKLTEQMAQAGADAVLVVSPFYYKSDMTTTALVKHYETVANYSPVPVILYSVPALTGLDLPATAVRDLAGHTNIVGMKDSGGDISKISGMVRQTETEDFQMLAGSVNFMLPALVVGCVGAVCAFGNILVEPICELLEAYQSGNITRAITIHKQLIEPANAIKVTGVPGIKCAMEWFGLYGGPSQLPVQDLTHNKAKDLKNIFIKNGWLKQF